MLVSSDERERLILSLAPIVNGIAHKYAHVVRAGATLEVGDLRAAGWVAATRAVDRFDPTRGTPLEAYASRVIHGAILNEVRRLDPVSERVRATIRTGARAHERFRATHGREPSAREMEDLVPGIGDADARAAMAPQHGFVDSPDPLTHVTGERSAEDIALAHLTKIALADAVARLRPSQRRVIEEHYFADEPLKAIAGRSTVTPQRISQLHLAGLQRLRAGMLAEAG